MRRILWLIAGSLMLCAVAVLAFGFLSGGSRQSIYPTATPRTTAVPPPTWTPVSSTGYLWWAENKKDRVPVIGPPHLDPPSDATQLELWIDAGEACAAFAGARVAPGSTPKRLFAKAVEVLDGNCRGFRGWVDLDAWHPERP